MDKYIGKKLDGRFEIQKLIGSGGMANVYKAKDRLDENESIVAVKILKKEYQQCAAYISFIGARQKRFVLSRAVYTNAK